MREGIGEFIGSSNLEDVTMDIIIQPMINGAANSQNSGRGVLYTRDPMTGEDKLSGRFGFGMAGTEIVGRTKAGLSDMDGLHEKMPKVYDELIDIKNKLERKYGKVQEVEFVVENGGVNIQNIRVTQKKSGAKILLNDESLRAVLQNGFSGFTPVIMTITPVTSIFSLLGLVEHGVDTPAHL